MPDFAMSQSIPSIFKPKENETSQFFAAIEKGDQAQVTTLLSKNSELLQARRGGGKGMTPFHLAAREGQTEIFKKLFNEYKQNPGDIEFDTILNGFTPLHMAAYFGHQEIVEEIVNAILEQNLSVDIKDKIKKKWINVATLKKSYTPLQFAAGREIPIEDADYSFSNSNLEIVKLLVGTVENPQKTDELKRTPLHFAASTGRKPEVINKLCEKLSTKEINAKNERGNTPLHLAYAQGNTSTAELLIKNGADPHLKNNKEQTASDVGKEALKNTDWKAAMLAGGIGESACPMEKPTELVELLIGKVKDLGIPLGATIGIIVTAGLALISLAIIFITASYNDLKEIAAERGLSVERSTIYRYKNMHQS